MNASESVLLVDDDVRLRERLARALRERDYDVVDCADTTSALRIAAVREFWGAVVDMRMPGGSGLELIRKLRRLPEPPRFRKASLRRWFPRQPRSSREPRCQRCRPAPR